jgi:ubiquinone/menaquinone biosynthesis C-methylase UbiE
MKNATNLEFPSESFDVAFSISSIEHLGGSNHSGSLRCLKEVERVLKTGGIAVITTEYILNDKEHPEFFNRRTILQKLQLVEPLDLRITTRTLDTAIGMFDTADATHPHILIRYGDILLTSIMLVFEKKE